MDKRYFLYSIGQNYFEFIEEGNKENRLKVDGIRLIRNGGRFYADSEPYDYEELEDYLIEE